MEDTMWEPVAPIGDRYRDHAVQAVKVSTGRTHWRPFGFLGYAACGQPGRFEYRGSMDMRPRVYCRSCMRAMVSIARRGWQP